MSSDPDTDRYMEGLAEEAGLFEGWEDEWFARNAEPLRRMLAEAEASLDAGQGIVWDKEAFLERAKAELRKQQQGR